MKKLGNYLFIIGFAAILFMPVILKYGGARYGLSGVSTAAEFPEINRKGILDGTVQDMAGTYFSEHLPGRDLMIKVRNQMIYSLYDKSPNKNIIIGKNKNLFEEEYVSKYVRVYPPVKEEKVRQLCDSLTAIRDALALRGKEFYVFITPGKARYYEEDVPDLYYYAAPFKEREGNYEVFTRVLNDYDLAVYDSIPFLNEYGSNAPVPLFPKTGTHWTRVTGAYVADDFKCFLGEHSRFKFPDMRISYAPSETPVSPDSDLFDAFNVFSKPYDTYYSVEVETEAAANEQEEKPRLMCRGGSFMGQTIYYLIRGGLFGGDLYVENTDVYRDNYSSHEIFSDYSELDLKQALEETDIVIFEVNEAHIPVMGFGIIEYLEEHPEILEN